MRSTILPPYQIRKAKIPQQIRLMKIKRKPRKITSTYTSNFNGAAVIMNRNVSLLRRFIWLIIVIICSGLCLYQTGNRFALYLKNPVKMNIEIMRNRTVKYPSFTICPFGIDSMGPIRRAQFNHAEMSQNMSLVSVWNLLDHAGFTTNQMWDLNQIDETNTNVSFVMKKTLPTEHFPTIEKFPRIFSYLGICMTVKAAGSVNFMGPSFVMRMEQIIDTSVSYTDDASFTVYPHDDNIPALHHAFFHGQIIPREQLISIALTTSTFTHMNKTSKPCQDSVTSSTCWTNCLESILTSRTSCRLPFMTSSAPNCTSTIDSKRVYEAILDIYLNTKSSDCECLPKCIDIFYEMNLDMQHKLNNMTMVEIYFLHNNFLQITEVYAYGFVSFICELGGNFGFYLGVCLLTIVEMFEQLLFTFHKAVSVK